MAENPQSPTEQRSRRVPPRVILFWIFVIILISLGLYAAAPWILPVRVYEGPLVQMTDAHGATLVWYTTRPAECRLVVDTGDGEQIYDAEQVGRRNRVRVAGLEAGQTYPYRVQVGNRVLTNDLTLQTVADDDRAYSFLVFGDSGRASQEQYLLAAAMMQVRPQPTFLVHTGDIVYSDGARRKYEARFFAPYRHLLSRVSFWPCVGNHDIDKTGVAEPYQEVFETPANGPEGLPADQNYWFDYASSRFAVFDSNVNDETLSGRIAPWLREVMSDMGPRWKFAVCHHPPYTGGKYPSDQRLVQHIVPVLEETGVTIVFSGHDHNYQRTKPLRGGAIVESGQGVTYVVTGAGGAALYQPKSSTPDFLAAFDFDRHSFTHVIIDGDELTLRQIDADGEILDKLQLRHHAKDVSTPVNAKQP